MIRPRGAAPPSVFLLIAGLVLSIPAAEAQTDPTGGARAAGDLVVEVDGWSSRTIDVTVQCSQPTVVTLSGQIGQTRNSGSATVSGAARVSCTDQVSTTLALAPHQDRPRYPFRRLLPGPATLEVEALGGQSVADVELPITLHSPDLEKRVQQSTGDDLDVRLLGVRVTGKGRSLIMAEVICHRPLRDVDIDVHIVAPGPGGSYHPAEDSSAIDRCNGTERVDLDVSAATFPFLPYRADILPAGPAEVYLFAHLGQALHTTSIDMRPIALRRQIRPETLRVHHIGPSRLRIGTAGTGGVRVSLRCGRTTTFTVFAAIGQRTDDVVHQRAGRRVVPCTDGRTLVFEVRWPGNMRADRRSAINVRAINGNQTQWGGPWQQTQGAWRVTR